MQKILLAHDGNTHLDYVYNWLHYNSIEFQNLDLWDDQSQRFNLNRDIENTLIVTGNTFLDGLANEDPLQGSVDMIRDFCSRGNQLWLIGSDLATMSMRATTEKLLCALDPVLPRGGMMLLMDGEPLSGSYQSLLKNIRIWTLETTQWDRMCPRHQSPSLIKTDATHDYLLTMVRKPKIRPHREVLWNELNNRSGLLDRGRVIVRENRTPDEQWEGRINPEHGWQDGHPSMDLYLDCFLEVVPEVCSSEMQIYSEKIHKPLMTRTPFLVVATQGFLYWIKKRGFKTFDNLIDESYDQLPDVNDRVARMTDVLEHIINNGSKEFYWACQDVLDHNLSRLFELTGSWQYRFDQVMWRMLEDFDLYIRRA